MATSSVHWFTFEDTNIPIPSSPPTLQHEDHRQQYLGGLRGQGRDPLDEQELTEAKGVPRLFEALDEGLGHQQDGARGYHE